MTDKTILILTAALGRIIALLKTVGKVLPSVVAALCNALNALLGFTMNAIRGLVLLAFCAALVYVAWYGFDSISKKLDTISEQGKLADWKFEHQFHPVEAKTNDLYVVEAMIEVGNHLLELTKNRDPYTYNGVALTNNWFAAQARAWGIDEHPTSVTAAVTHLWAWLCANWSGWKPVDDNLEEIARESARLRMLWKSQFDQFFFSDPTQNITFPNNEWKREMQDFITRANGRANWLASDLHISQKP
jgi:hypothetical protein